MNYGAQYARWGWIGAFSASAAWLHMYPPPYLATEFVVGAAFGAMLLLLHPFDQAIDAAVFLRPIRFCVTLCYSLYLVHYPLVRLISHGLYVAGWRSAWETLLRTVPLCAAASLLIAIPFHFFVERRFWNKGTTTVPPRLTAALPAEAT